MEPHRPARTRSDAERPRRPRPRSDAMPLDASWLEAEAIRYVARWESTARGVSDVLDKRLRARCDRTGEDATEVARAIPGVIENLKARGYVDDERFALQVSKRMRKQGQSIAQIRSRLLAKGVDANLLGEIERAEAARIAEAHGSIDGDLLAAFETARRRRIGPYCVDEDKRRHAREKHLGILARKGFSQEISYRVIDASAEETPERVAEPDRG